MPPFGHMVISWQNQLWDVTPFDLCLAARFQLLLAGWLDCFNIFQRQRLYYWCRNRDLELGWMSKLLNLCHMGRPGRDPFVVPGLTNIYPWKRLCVFGCVYCRLEASLTSYWIISSWRIEWVFSGISTCRISEVNRCGQTVDGKQMLPRPMPGWWL